MYMYNIIPKETNKNAIHSDMLKTTIDKSNRVLNLFQKPTGKQKEEKLGSEKQRKQNKK